MTKLANTSLILLSLLKLLFHLAKARQSLDVHSLGFSGSLEVAEANFLDIRQIHIHSPCNSGQCFPLRLL